MVQIGSRALQREAPGGHVGSAAQVLHSASPIGALLEVMRDLERDLVERTGEDLLQSLGTAAMQHRALRRGLALVEYLAVERVRERVALDDASIGKLPRIRQAQDVAATRQPIAALLERRGVHVRRRRGDGRGE